MEVGHWILCDTYMLPVPLLHVSDPSSEARSNPGKKQRRLRLNPALGNDREAREQDYQENVFRVLKMTASLALQISGPVLKVFKKIHEKLKMDPVFLIDRFQASFSSFACLTSTIVLTGSATQNLQLAGEGSAKNVP